MSQSKRYVVINQSGSWLHRFNSARELAVFLLGKPLDHWDIYCLVPDRGVRDVAEIEWDLDEVWDRMKGHPDEPSRPAGLE